MIDGHRIRHDARSRLLNNFRTFKFSLLVYAAIDALWVPLSIIHWAIIASSSIKLFPDSVETVHSDVCHHHAYIINCPKYSLTLTSVTRHDGSEIWISAQSSSPSDLTVSRVDPIEYGPVDVSSGAAADIYVWLRDTVRSLQYDQLFGQLNGSLPQGSDTGLHHLIAQFSIPLWVQNNLMEMVHALLRIPMLSIKIRVIAENGIGIDQIVSWFGFDFRYHKPFMSFLNEPLSFTIHRMGNSLSDWDLLPGLGNRASVRRVGR